MSGLDPKDMRVPDILETSNKRKEPSGNREFDRSKDSSSSSNSKIRREEIQGADLTWKEVVRELATSNGLITFGDLPPEDLLKQDNGTEQVRQIDSALNKMRLAKTTRDNYRKQLTQCQIICKVSKIAAYPATKDSAMAFGRALVDCKEIPSSRAIYLSEFKNGYECWKPLPEEAKLAHSAWFKALDLTRTPGKGQAPPLTLEHLTEIGKNIADTDMANFHREGKIRRVEMDVIYGVLVCWRFTFMRPDDLHHCKRTTGTGEEKNAAKFHIASSKVDQGARGWALRYGCACNYDLPGKTEGLSRNICPVHSCSDAEWNYAAAMTKKILAGVFTNLMGKYASDYRMWSLYSIRVGGCRACRMSLPQESVALIGRRKDTSTEQHYSSSVVLNPDSCRLLPWPLVVPKTFGPKA